MERTYTIPCQKTTFTSCEGCPKTECEAKHFSGAELQAVH